MTAADRCKGRQPFGGNSYRTTSRHCCPVGGAIPAAKPLSRLSAWPQSRLPGTRPFPLAHITLVPCASVSAAAGPAPAASLSPSVRDHCHCGATSPTTTSTSQWQGCSGSRSPVPAAAHAPTRINVFMLSTFAGPHLFHQGQYRLLQRGPSAHTSGPFAGLGGTPRESVTCVSSCVLYVVAAALAGLHGALPSAHPRVYTDPDRRVSDFAPERFPTACTQGRAA
jgi:hypothetical protein